VCAAISHFELFQPFGSTELGVGGFHTSQHQWKGSVIQRVQRGDQIEKLKDKSNALTAQVGKIIIVERA
jgi:hypothetical protein